jgi:chemotaxis protein CheD
MMNNPVIRLKTAQHPTAKPHALPGFQSINRYWDKVNNIFTAKILPGEFYVTTNHELITTVLGSCVSACIRDPIFGIGGMNHFMLPLEGNHGSSAWKNAGNSAATRYGNVAMELLINNILKHGGERKNLEVKVFGGGRILTQMTDVGRRNIDFVREYLQVEGLNIAAEDLGDTTPRKVNYDPISGKVRVKKLRSLHNDTIITREQTYMRDLEEQPTTGEIDLF